MGVLVGDADRARINAGGGAKFPLWVNDLGGADEGSELKPTGTSSGFMSAAIDTRDCAGGVDGRATQHQHQQPTNQTNKKKAHQAKTSHAT